MKFLKIPSLMLLVLSVFYLNRQMILIGSVPLLDLTQFNGPAIASLLITLMSFVLLLLRFPLPLCTFFSILLVDWRIAIAGVSFALIPLLFLSNRFQKNPLLQKWYQTSKIPYQALDQFQSQTGLGLSFEVMLLRKDSLLRSIFVLLQERSIIFQELILGSFFGNLIHIVIDAFAFQTFLHFAVVRSLGEIWNTQYLMIASILLLVQMRLSEIFAKARSLIV